MKNLEENKFKDFISNYLEYFFEDYKRIQLRIIGIKKKDDKKKIWDVIHLRGDFCSIKKERVKFFRSIYNRVILLEYYMDIEEFHEILTCPEFSYKLENEGRI